METACRWAGPHSLLFAGFSLTEGHPFLGRTGQGCRAHSPRVCPGEEDLSKAWTSLRGRHPGRPARPGIFQAALQAWLPGRVQAPGGGGRTCAPC